LYDELTKEEGDHLKKYKIPALERAIDILNLIAESKEVVTLMVVCEKLSIAKSTAYTTLNVLEYYDFIKKNEDGGFEIGFKLYELGLNYLSKVNITEVAKPYLKELVNHTGLTVHLAMLHKGEMLYLDKVESNSFIKFSTYPGMKEAIHNSSLGKAVSAFLDEDKLDEIINEKGLERYTSNTITDYEEFKEQLIVIRENGYALEDEEGEIGVRCVGAPIFGGDSTYPTYAVSVVAHKSELTYEKVPKIGAKVKEIAERISKKI